MKKLTLNTIIITLILISSVALCSEKKYQERKIDNINATIVDMNRDADTMKQGLKNDILILDKISDDRQKRFEEMYDPQNINPFF